ncbi:MAG: LPS assembly lipoprotein LptE [Pseudomonadota bacterium]|nr:LPS assembly lipoprotein LptE [Pseudomonadota bacterium]HJO35977.1 LPS assembly lipoprotein LptE [Gammaproteobacteria bacterium]
MRARWQGGRLGRLVLLVLLAAGLGACGFRLAGRAPLPPAYAQVYVQSEPVGDELALELASTLAANGARVIPGARRDAAVVTLRAAPARRQVVSVDRAGKVQEYALVLTATLSARAPGVADLPPTRFVRRRDYVVDEVDVLANEAREDELLVAMRQDMVRAMLRRLAVAGDGGAALAR